MFSIFFFINIFISKGINHNTHLTIKYNKNDLLPLTKCPFSKIVSIKLIEIPNLKFNFFKFIYIFFFLNTTHLPLFFIFLKYSEY